MTAIGRSADLISETELKKESTTYLRLVQAAAQSGNLTRIKGFAATKTRSVTFR